MSGHQVAPSVPPRADWFPESPLLQTVLQYLARNFGRTYLVGGTVRDLIAGRRRHGDVDFTVSQGSGLHIARRVADRFAGAYYPLDPERGTGRAILHDAAGRLELDFAQLREPDMEADLAGRDFTVNALALDIRSGQLLDPTDGLADLRAGRLRAVSPRVFCDDPVRLLRAPRQAVELGLEIGQATRAQIVRDAPRLRAASAERLRDEVCRLLALPNGATQLPGLDALGLLTEVWPELAALKGLAQPHPHRYDAFTHTLQAVAEMEQLLSLIAGDAAPDEPALAEFRPDLAAYVQTTLSSDRPLSLLLKLAALFHDLGKPASHTVGDDGRVHFYGHARIGADLAGQAMKRLRFATAEERWLVAVARHHMRPLNFVNQGGASRRAIYRFYRDAGDAGVGATLLSLADARATWGQDLTPDRWQDHTRMASRLFAAYFEARERMVSPPALITGRDVIDHLSIAPGPEIGRLLEAVREAQAVGDVSTREEALALVRRRVSGA